MPLARCQIIEGPAPEIEFEIRTATTGSGKPTSKDDALDVISVRMTDEIRDAFAALFDETFMQQLVWGMGVSSANPTTSTACVMRRLIASNWLETTAMLRV